MDGKLKKYPMKEIMQILPEKPGGRREKTGTAARSANGLRLGTARLTDAIRGRAADGHCPSYRRNPRTGSGRARPVRTRAFVKCPHTNRTPHPSADKPASGHGALFIYPFALLKAFALLFNAVQLNQLLKVSVLGLGLCLSSVEQLLGSFGVGAH